MTYEEIVKQFIEFGEHVHIIQGSDLDTVALHVVPVAWFIAMKSAGSHSIGKFEGDENRLVGTENLAFEEITPQFIKERVGNALAEQLSQMLDTGALRDFLSALEKERETGRINLPPGRGRGLER
jgi:hypothetical protein